MTAATWESLVASSGRPEKMISPREMTYSRSGERRHVMDVRFGNEDRVAKCPDRGDAVDDRRNDRRRQTFGWLVQQQQFRICGERAGDRYHTIALCAGPYFRQNRESAM
jgi:hypothetical protein